VRARQIDPLPWLAFWLATLLAVFAAASAAGQTPKPAPAPVVTPPANIDPGMRIKPLPKAALPTPVIKPAPGKDGTVIVPK
jgi:hypothetical protein